MPHPSQTSDKPLNPECTAALNALRQQLAQLVGRLIAKEWLRTQEAKGAKQSPARAAGRSPDAAVE